MIRRVADFNVFFSLGLKRAEAASRNRRQTDQNGSRASKARTMAMIDLRKTGFFVPAKGSHSTAARGREKERRDMR